MVVPYSFSLIVGPYSVLLSPSPALFVVFVLKCLLVCVLLLFFQPHILSGFLSLSVGSYPVIQVVPKNCDF